MNKNAHLWDQKCVVWVFSGRKFKKLFGHCYLIVRSWSSAAFELGNYILPHLQWLLLQNFGKWIKDNKKDIFNLKTPKKYLKDNWNTWEFNNKQGIKPWCLKRRNDDGYRN